MARVAQAMEMMAQTQADMAQTQTEILNRQLVAQPRAGNISDFRRLVPPFFTGSEKPLDAEQWLIQIEDLLTAALIPDAERVSVVKIQLLDNARTWWQTEETRFHAPTWDDFRRAFLTRFFPRTARTLMARQFMSLTQGTLSVDEYASEFSRLSRFVPQLVATDEDRARRFEDGLRFELQQHIISLHYPTYVEVLEAAREHEQLTLRFRESQQGTQEKQGSVGTKRPLQLSTQRLESAKRPAVNPLVICNFCGRPGHTKRECRSANGLCLICGAGDHQIRTCPKKKYDFEQRTSVQARQLSSRERPAQSGRAYT